MEAFAALCLTIGIGIFISGITNSIVRDGITEQCDKIGKVIIRDTVYVCHKEGG